MSKLDIIADGNLASLGQTIKTYQETIRRLTKDLKSSENIWNDNTKEVADLKESVQSLKQELTDAYKRPDAIIKDMRKCLKTHGAKLRRLTQRVEVWETLVEREERYEYKG